MKMDRNLHENAGTGKYAIVSLRKLHQPGLPMEATAAVQLLADLGVLDWGATGTERECFVIKLKDRHAAAALKAYADSIRPTDPEFASEVTDMALRSGPYSPWCKEPD